MLSLDKGCGDGMDIVHYTGAVCHESQRLWMWNLWVYVLCTLLVGVSLALLLFPYFCEGKLEPVS
jgi:hypothetical protein